MYCIRLNCSDSQTARFGRDSEVNYQLIIIQVTRYGGFHGHGGTPNVIIHFERWDFSLKCLAIYFRVPPFLETPRWKFVQPDHIYQIWSFLGSEGESCGEKACKKDAFEQQKIDEYWCAFELKNWVDKLPWVYSLVHAMSSSSRCSRDRPKLRNVRSFLRVFASSR